MTRSLITDFLSFQMSKMPCGLLIRGGKTDPEYFVWYARAVDKGLTIVRLAESYLQSLPEDFNGAIPDSVMRSASRGGMLSAGSRAYFYRYLYQTRKEYPAIYERHREDIRNYLALQIEEHRMNENLAVLYKEALIDPDIRPDNAGDLTKLSYLSHLRTTHLDMKRSMYIRSTTGTASFRCTGRRTGSFWRTSSTTAIRRASPIHAIE